MIMFVTGKKSLNPLPLRNVQQVTSPYNTETDQVEVVFLIYHQILITNLQGNV